MKKLISSMLMFIILASLVSCSSNSEESATNETTLLPTTTIEATTSSQAADDIYFEEISGEAYIDELTTAFNLSDDCFLELSAEEIQSMSGGMYDFKRMISAFGQDSVIVSTYYLSESVESSRNYFSTTYERCEEWEFTDDSALDMVLEEDYGYVLFGIRSNEDQLEFIGGETLNSVLEEDYNDRPCEYINLGIHYFVGSINVTILLITPTAEQVEAFFNLTNVNGLTQE